MCIFTLKRDSLDYRCSKCDAVWSAYSGSRDAIVRVLAENAIVS